MTGTFYPQIFFESAHTASIIPFSSEPTYYAMLAFGDYAMMLPFLLAVTGAALGYSFNWCVGKFLFNAWSKTKKRPTEAQYHKAAQLFNRYGIWVLLLSWMPLLNFVPAIAGFLGTRFKIALPLLVAGAAAHYGLPLL